jgi:hypothetical protein
MTEISTITNWDEYKKAYAAYIESAVCVQTPGSMWGRIEIRFRLPFPGFWGGDPSGAVDSEDQVQLELF